MKSDSKVNHSSDSPCKALEWVRYLLLDVFAMKGLLLFNNINWSLCIYLEKETTAKWAKCIKNQGRKSPLDKMELICDDNSFFELFSYNEQKQISSAWFSTQR